MKYQPLVAEFLGTFLLTLVVVLSLGTPFDVPTPILAGLTLGLMVYLIGPISGAQCNPAVTLGLLAVKKIESTDAVWFIVMQVLGAYAASFVGFYFFNDFIIAIPSAADGMMVGIAEALGAAVLVLAVSSVVWKKVGDGASGFVIGTGLVLGALVASTAGNGIINPAVAIGLRSISFVYLLAPIVGGVFAAFGYRWLVGK
jgi:aquaporin Z